MRTKVLFVACATCLLLSAAWLMRGPSPAQAEVPEKYHDTVAKGLDFLAKHQAKDGHWAGDDGKHPVAMTGLVGIALLMERRADTRGRGELKLREGKHSVQINKAVDWLLQQSKPGRDGLIFSEHSSETSRYMEGHGLATMFLAGVLKSETDKARRRQLTQVVARAVTYIVKAQSSQGGWYHTSKAEGHDFDAILPTALQIQALQAAENTDLAIPARALANGHEYLQRAAEKYEADNKRPARNRRLSDTVVALACRYRRIDNERLALQNRWLEFCAREWPTTRKIEFGADELNHFFCAQGRFVGGAKHWTGYRNAVFDQLQAAQNKDGSWPGSVGIGGGSVYSTAIWCAVLQLDNEQYPAMQDSLREIT